MSKRIEQAGHIWRSNGIKTKSSKGKIDGKRSSSRPKQRWFYRVNDNLNKRSRRITTENNMERAR